MRRIGCKSVFFLLCVVASVSRGYPASALSIEVGPDHVTVSNVTRGGSVLLLSCTRTSRNGVLVTRRESTVLQDDGKDGIVRFTAKEPIPLRSVWIAIDTRSGATAVAAPSGFPLKVVSIPPEAFRGDVEGQFATYEVDRPHMSLLVVRPNGGAWIVDAREGGKGDHDGISNGHLSLAFADGYPVMGKDHAPKHLTPGDVVAAIDTGRLVVFMAEVGR